MYKYTYRHTVVHTGGSFAFYSVHESDAEHRFLFKEAAVITKVLSAGLVDM